MWNDLTMSERAGVIKMAVKAGLRDMKSIRDFYDNSLKYADGGSKPGMTGMMKSKLAIASHFGNPTARRMTNYDTRNYTFPNRYDEKTGLQEIGNVYVSSYDNLVTPQIQDNGKELEFVPEEKIWDREHDPRSYAQSIKFYGPNANEDARYFGEHYKEVAPMMNLYADGGPKATYGKPYYSYDKNMQIETDNGKPILNYSATLPEVNIIPDSKKSPADRNEARRFREKVFSDNAEREAKDYTQRQIMKSQRDWDNSLERKALGYAQDAMTGVGIGADIVSGLPIYSSLKGSRILSEANSLPEYVEGGLWLAPIGGVVGKEAYNVGKNAWNTSKNTIPSALEYAYNRDKRLSKIGTINDYEEYIKTVFPQSSVKDIQYHMGPKGLTELKPSTGEIWNTNPNARGIYVTPERSYIEAIRKFTTDRLEKPSALTYIKRNLTPNGWKEANEQFTDIYPLLIDTRNPMRTRGNWTWGMKDKKYQEVMNQYDAIINSGPRWWQSVNKMPETIVPKSRQVHILGTDADVEGFRNFMSSNATNKKAEGGSIHIAPSKRGTFTAAATKHGMGVQEFASKVLANKDNYSSAMVKKANFAKNASKWKHALGGYLFEEGGPKNTNREYKSANSWSPSNLHNILTPVSTALMNFGKYGRFTDVWKGGTPEETYFLPKNIQRQEFLSRGYTEAPNDYGLVKKAVNNRNIPVYQTKADDISREKVIPISNINDRWFGKEEAELEHPGHYPTAVYYSPYTNEYYQKGWDLNDYGGGSGAYNNYDAFDKIKADIADAIGSPVVTTTGISRIGSLTDMMKEKDTKNIAIDFLNSKGLVPMILPTKELPLLNMEGKPFYDLEGKPFTYTVEEYVPSLPEITITGKRRKKVK